MERGDRAEARELVAEAEAPPRWELSALYAPEETGAPLADLARALAQAQSFEQRYRGQLGALGAAALAEAVDAWEAIESTAARAVSFVQLAFAADMRSPELLALHERAHQEASRLRGVLMGFQLEWLALDEPTAERLLRAPALRHRACLLRRLRRQAPHRLSLAEERILELTANCGPRAFSRLRDEIIARTRFGVVHGGTREEVGLEALIARLSSPSRPVRRTAADALTQGLREQRDLLLSTFNALLQDKAVRDELRGHRDAMDERHLDNEIDGAIVGVMLEACERHRGVVARFLRLKARLLGLERLEHLDRLAPVAQPGRSYAFDEARRLVIEAHGGFSRRLGDAALAHFEGRWIDAQPRPGKRDGAFALATVPSAHPYVLLSYTGSLADVLTLAHEVGHGIHLFLAQQRGFFAQAIPVILAETASVSGEALVLQRMLAREADARARLALLVERIDRCMNNVFRQVALTRFEQSVHAACRRAGALGFEHVCELWVEAHHAMYGSSLQLGEGYEVWWLAIPHLWHAPFYCYGYAFGELLSLSVRQRCEEESARSRFLELLAAGGSEEPVALLGRLGFDITDPAFWEGGLELIEELVAQAEQLCASVEPESV